MWVRRFLCTNIKCQSKTFGAKLEGIVKRHAQRSERLIETHLAIGIKLSAEAGSDLATELGMKVSADSLLRAIKTTDITTSETPRVLGIDDWAIRRRERYGTILVDLEKHKVVDVLEGRDAQTLAEWLDTHPGVEIISRDRSNEYAKASNEAAPDAQQVADRWHLLKNVQEMLEKWLRTVQTRLSTLNFEGTIKTQAQELFDIHPSFSRMTKASIEASQANLEKRIANYYRVKELHIAGMGILNISKELGINRQTVRSYLHADSPPSRKLVPKADSILDPYIEYLGQRLAEGCENATQLWRELVEKGYPGKPWQVLKWVSFRRSTPAKNAPNKTQKPKQSVTEVQPKHFLPSGKQLAWLLTKKADQYSDKEQLILDYLAQDQQLMTMRHRVLDFKTMLTQQKSENFDTWLKEAETSDITVLQTFTKGLRQDYDAVKAAMSSIWSNGQVEGKVNKLKFIKRQMFGRASFDLLRKRVLLAG